MRRPLVPWSLTLLALAQAVYASDEANWRVVRKDPRFDALVPEEAIVESVSTGHRWVEGPLWDHRGGYLLFSDIPNNVVLRWSPHSGTDIFLSPSGYTGKASFTGREPGSNGLAFDADGRLLLAQHGDRRITRLEPDASWTTLVDRYEGKRLNSPNDLILASNGDLYFTDPPFGLPETFDDPQKELSFSGVYRLSRDGSLTLLTRELRAPNGVALSPDEKRLYVSNAERHDAVWMVFDIRDDGTVGKGRVFFDATAWVMDGTGAPDGIEVDRQGNLFTAGPRGLHVFSPSGEHLGTFEVDVPVSNCAWGEDGSVLFISADTAIYRVRLTTGTGSVP